MTNLDYYIIGAIVLFTFVGYLQGFLTVLIELVVTMITFSSVLVWKDFIPCSWRIIGGILFFVMLIVSVSTAILSSNPYKTSPSIRFFSGVFGFLAGCFLSTYIIVLLHMYCPGLCGPIEKSSLVGFVTGIIHTLRF